MADFDDDPEERYTCWICFELFKGPITLPCGHSYCRKCLVEIVNKCPLCSFCRRDITIPIPSVNATLESQVLEYIAGTTARSPAAAHGGIDTQDEVYSLRN